MLRRLRMEVVTRVAWTSAVWVAALVMLVGGGVLALNGKWLAASGGVIAGLVLLWLCGAWVLPWGRDTLSLYYLRVRRVWRDWAGMLEWEESARLGREFKVQLRLTEMTPPPGLEREHARLIELLGRVDQLRTDTSLSFPERAKLVVTALQATRAIRDKLASGAQGRTPGRYAEALDRLAAESRMDYEATTSQVEGATETLIRKLTQLRPPVQVTAEHEALLMKARGYLAAMRDYSDAAYRQLDAESAARSAGALESARADLQAAIDTLRQRLASGGAWAAAMEVGAE